MSAPLADIFKVSEVFMNEPAFNVITKGFPIHTLEIHCDGHVIEIEPAAFRLDPATGVAEITLVTGDVLFVFPSTEGAWTPYPLYSK